MAKQNMEVERLSDPLGARISGIDLCHSLDNDSAKKIRQALLDHTIVVFPGQNLSENDQERFCGYFGELEPIRTGLAASSDHPAVLMITNAKDTGKPTALEDGEMMFHYDQCYYQAPCLGSTLYALAVPDMGGNTLFANCTRAYDALDASMKKLLDGLKALNYYDYDRDSTVRPEKIRKDAPQWTHPVVRTHPDTNKKALFVNRLMTLWIEGMDRMESDSLLDHLFDHIEKPEFVYEHTWSVGDLIIWDNRCSVHARTYFEPEKLRMMRRVTIRETRPVA